MKPNTRGEMVDKVIIDCLDEMYRKSQPSITWKGLREKSLDPNLGNRRVIEEHYLSRQDYEDILDKYMGMYSIQSEWDNNIDLVNNYLLEGGTKDRYVSAHTDENGDYHPGYRDYDKVPPIDIQIQGILDEYVAQGNVHPSCVDEIAKDVCKAIFQSIHDCKNFYVHNREEMGFRLNVSNYSPCSNFETVKEFYDNHPEIPLKKPLKEKK